jgi:dihydropyrimidine dehydrogenase (NAD+) subunit PreA
MCTAVMWRGFGIIDRLTEGLAGYLDEHGYSSVDDIRGKALPQIQTFFDLDLSLRQVAAVDSERCTGCELCVRACASGGFQAIEIVGDVAKIIGEKCDGCGLCVGVCPVDAISMESR